MLDDLEELKKIGNEQNKLLKEMINIQKEYYHDMLRELREIKIRTQEMGR